MVGLYDLLARIEPSPVVELNRAVAVAMRDGPAAGLELIDGILARGDLAEYHLAHSARARNVPAVGADCGRPSRLRTGASAHATGAGAAVPERRLAKLPD